MSQEKETAGFSRRSFIKQAATGTVLLWCPWGYAWPGKEDPGFFNEEERQALAAISYFIFPLKDDLIGMNFSAVHYIETLLTAFDFSPPRIFAAGPFSGRQPFPNGSGEPSNQYPQDSFKEFLPLTREQEAAWRLKIYGSSKISLNAAVGLRELIKSGIQMAMETIKTPIEQLDAMAMERLHQSMSQDFRFHLTEFVVESVLSAPEYMGNPGLVGWKIANFEGDIQPLGYTSFDTATGKNRERSSAPVSRPSPGLDPAPLSDGTRAILAGLAYFTGGRVF